MTFTQARCSDWVEDGQTNFKIKPGQTSKVVAPGHSNDIDVAPQNGDDNAGPRAQTSRGPTLQGGVMERERGITPGLSGQADGIMANAPRIPQAESRNVGAGIFHSWLEKNYGKVAPIPKGAIIDIKGQWDDSGHVLHALGLNFDKVAPNQLSKTDLSSTAVILVDCAGALNPDAIQALRDFVLGGGYLVTTDWALDGTLARLTSISPNGYISWNSGYSYPETVDAIVVDPVETLVRGCVPYARWRLDDKCQTVHVRDSVNVHVLVRSNQLAKDDPDNKGILAATFPMGKGRVLHIVGHFDNNSTNAFNTTLPDAEPTMGISLRQGITTNFVMSGLKSHGLLNKIENDDNKN